MKKYAFTIMLALLAISCYKEEPLESELGKPKYTVEDSDDPAKHYIYELWKNTGVFILYEYDEVDYKWDVASISNNVLTRMDPDVLQDAVGYLKETLTGLYDETFIRKYFPLKVFLADTLYNSLYGKSAMYDETCSSGRSYIALAKLRKDEFPKSPETVLAARGKINGELWGNFIYQNGLVEIPEGFFSPSAGYYSTSFQNHTGKDDPATIMQLGLWGYDEKNMANDYMTPSEAGDVSDFVEMITTHTEAEMRELMAGYDNLAIKYNILVSTIRDVCGVDLQEIGNAK